MTRTIRFLLASILVAGLFLGLAPSATPTRAAETVTLTVQRVRLRQKVHPRSGVALDTLELKAQLPDTGVLKSFDPSVTAVRVSVAGVDVIATVAPQDAKSFRIRRKRGSVRRWRYVDPSTAPGVGKRHLTVNARNGNLTLVVKRAFLRDITDAGSDDVEIVVAIGDVEAVATFAFDVRSATLWRYIPLPSGGPGSGPVGPVTWAPITSGALVNTARADLEVARTPAELTALWAGFGLLSAEPQVDFETEMVVALSSVIRGPGPTLPIMDLTNVSGAGSAVRIDWRLRGCQWGFCPGAPSPVTCPTATPFQIVRVTRASVVQPVQGATLGVCP